MSVFRNSTVGDLTRGGQTTIHFMRMICQVTKKFFHICLFLYIFSVGIFFYYSTTYLDRYYGFKWFEAYIVGEVLKLPDRTTTIQSLNNKEVTISYQQLLFSKPIKNAIERLYSQLILSLAISFFGIAGIGFIIVRFIYNTGRLQASDDFVRGTEIVDIRRFKKIVKQFNKNKNKGKSSGISLAGVELPYKFDKSHVILIGSTGTGKSVNFREALSSVRRLKKRAIVYDVSGNFIKHFYRKDKDIILNPLDERSAYWDIWCDCKEESDFISLAEALIPDGYKKDFFDTAAKMVFSSLAYQLGQRGNPTTKKLMDLILKVDFQTIIETVEGTDAASLLNNEAGRMAASIRGVMSANTRALKFLREDGQRFSIADWVNKDNDSWVFISCNDKQVDMMRPIITAWFNIFTSNMLSLTEDESRRIYMFIDELPSLNKIPSLINFLAQGRKYGGSGFIGIQNHSQLIEIYGKNGSDAICDLCSTWVVLRCNSKEGAKWAAENLGNRESIETNEGLSFGVNDIRDGVNVNKNRTDRLIVSPTEIMNLPDLTGYLKFGRGFPVVKFESKYKQYPVLSESFISRSNYEPVTHQEFLSAPFEHEIIEGKKITKERETKPNSLDTKQEKINKKIKEYLNEMEL